MKEEVKHLFFDLDRTIWDYETNSKETLIDLHKIYLNEIGKFTSQEFIDIFRVENLKLWDLFTNNKIDKEYLRQERFYRTLSKLGIEDQKLGIVLEEHYIQHTPSKKRLIPGTIEVLSALSSSYTLHIITNGFEEVQHFKLKNCGLDHFFDQVITSDRADARKPNRQIFDFALECSGAKIDESVMIGDDPDVDIQGALDAGWKHVLLVNTMNISHELSDVKEFSTLKQLIPALL